MKKNLQKALLLGIVIGLIGICAHNEFEHVKNIAVIEQRMLNASNEDYEIRIVDALTDKRGITYECVLDGE